MWVGISSVKAIFGNKLIPGLLDHYLAATGYEGQQTNEAEDPDRLDNLWYPPPGDPGTHGAFGDRARSHSPQLWANRHRNLLAGIAVVALTVAATLTISGHRE